ncbi:MAG TPA: hypothetical protein VH572_04430 [Gaiella sp.]
MHEAVHETKGGAMHHLYLAQLLYRERVAELERVAALRATSAQQPRLRRRRSLPAVRLRRRTVAACR